VIRRDVEPPTGGADQTVEDGVERSVGTDAEASDFGGTVFVRRLVEGPHANAETLGSDDE
jgi:hypothetical protein